VPIGTPILLDDGLEAALNEIVFGLLDRLRLLVSSRMTFRQCNCGGLINSIRNMVYFSHWRPELLQYSRVFADKKRVAQSNLRVIRALENSICLTRVWSFAKTTTYLAVTRFLVALTYRTCKKI